MSYLFDSSVFPSDQWVRARVQAWTAQLFEDVTVIDEAGSRLCGLGVTDYLRLVLDSGCRDSRSFAELLSQARPGAPSSRFCGAESAWC